MKITLLYAATVAALFTAMNTVSAGEPILSPRAQANQIRVVPAASASDVRTEINRPLGNGKAWAHAQSLRKVGAKVNVDLAHRPNLAISPKDPRFELKAREFQIAPLK